LSYDGEILHADAYRPCAGQVLGFVYRVIVTKLFNDIFYKKAVLPQGNHAMLKLFFSV